MVEVRKIYEEEANHPLSDESSGGMSPARPVAAKRCLQCQENDCLVCPHKTPEFPSGVQQAPSDLRGQMQSDRDEIAELLDKARDYLARFREGKTVFACRVDNIRFEIGMAASNWTDSVRRDKRKLLELVKAKELERVNRMAAMEEEVEQHVASLETFKKYSEILLSSGTAGDLAKSANSLHCRAEVLPLSFEVCIQYTCISVCLLSVACYAIRA